MEPDDVPTPEEIAAAEDLRRFEEQYGDAYARGMEFAEADAQKREAERLRQERLARRLPPGVLEQGFNLMSQAMGYPAQYGDRDPGDPTMMDYAKDSLNLLTGYPTQYIGRGQRTPSAPAAPEDPGFDYSAPTDEDLQNFMENYGAANQIQEQEKQDQLSLAEIRAMFGGGTPRGVGVRGFSRERQQILDDYKRQYAEGQAYESERRKAIEKETDAARQRFEEASDLQGKFKFDPTRVLESTGDVIAAAIFVGLSGAANAMAGQPGAKNQALEIINSTIDRDIQAQKMEYQQLKDQTSAADNLYARNMQLLQNERLAENLTKQQMLQLAEGQANISLKNVAANEATARFRSELNASLEKARLETAEAMFKYQADAAKKADFTVAQQGKFRESRLRAQNAVDTFKVAETQLAELAGNIQNFTDDDRTALQGVTDAMYRIIANRGDTSEAGRTSMGKALDSIFSQVDERFASARQLANIMKQMAFAMASERQSASSISNRDVQMFAQLLNDESAPIAQVGMFFQHMRAKAEINRDAIRLIETGQASIADADAIATQSYLNRYPDGPVRSMSPEGAPITDYLVNYGDIGPAPSAGLQSLELR